MAASMLYGYIFPAGLLPEPLLRMRVTNRELHNYNTSNHNNPCIPLCKSSKVHNSPIP